jgi:hypothetical protein
VLVMRKLSGKPPANRSGIRLHKKLLPCQALGHTVQKNYYKSACISASQYNIISIKKMQLAHISSIFAGLFALVNAAPAPQFYGAVQAYNVPNQQFPGVPQQQFPQQQFPRPNVPAQPYQGVPVQVPRPGGY